MNKVIFRYSFIFLMAIYFSSLQASSYVPRLDLSSVAKKISNFVSPKKDLSEDISNNLKQYIIASKNEDIRFLVDQYKVNQFWTIEEHRTSLGNIYRFDTPLRLALHCGNNESFSIILDHMDDPNCKMRTFRHILHDAVELKNVEAVEFLLAKKGLHVDGDKVENASRFSPLSDAVVIEGILRSDQQDVFQAIGLSAQESTKKLREISDDLSKIRKIIALLASHGGQLYTPRTNVRLFEQSRNLAQKNSVHERSFSE